MILTNYENVFSVKAYNKKADQTKQYNCSVTLSQKDISKYGNKVFSIYAVCTPPFWINDRKHSIYFEMEVIDLSMYESGAPVHSYIETINDPVSLVFNELYNSPDDTEDEMSMLPNYKKKGCLLNITYINAGYDSQFFEKYGDDLFYSIFDAVIEILREKRKYIFTDRKHRMKEC